MRTDIRSIPIASRDVSSGLADDSYGTSAGEAGNASPVISLTVPMIVAFPDTTIVASRVMKMGARV